jgi:hypothetical protein
MEQVQALKAPVWLEWPQVRVDLISGAERPETLSGKITGKLVIRLWGKVPMNVRSDGVNSVP